MKHPTLICGHLLHQLRFYSGSQDIICNAREDELEGDLLQQVIATTLEEELSLPCLDNVADYFSLAEEEAEFQDLEQDVKPETSPVEFKQLPPGLQYDF
jgi:hypothetical protein